MGKERSFQNIRDSEYEMKKFLENDREKPQDVFGLEEDDSIIHIVNGKSILDN